MATNEARIVVDIERGAFKSSLKGMERDVAVSGKRMGSVMSGAMSAGLGNVKNTMKGMLSGIGQHMKTLATFGGAIGAGMLVRDALHLQTLYRNIAYNVGKIPGQAMKWQDVQGLVNKAVEKTGAKAEDLAIAFDHVFKETGRLDVAKGTIEAIGVLATSTGGSMDAFADVAVRAVEKFQISTDRLPEAMSQFESLTGVGGPQLDELGRKFGMMAGAASDAGFTGEEGMRAVLNIMAQVDDLIGEKAEPALKRFFEVFRVGGKDIKDLEGKLGRKFKSTEGVKEKLSAVLAKGGAAREELVSKFSGDMALAFKQMVPAFDNTMKDALAAGKTKQEATVLAVEAFERSLTGADKKTRSFAENVENANRRLKDDPALQLQKAMNKLQEVMTSPKALESIKKLMDVLPPLAENMAKLLGFIMDHPLLSGGAAVVGKVGMSFAGGALNNLLFGRGGGVGAGAAGMGGGALSTAGYSAQQLGMSPARMSMTGGRLLVQPGTGWPMVPPSNEKMKMTGTQVAGGIASGLAALGVGAAIGSAAGEVLKSYIEGESANLEKGAKSREAAMDLVYGNEATGIGKPMTAAEHKNVGGKIAEMSNNVADELARTTIATKAASGGPLSAISGIASGKIGLGEMVNLLREGLGGDSKMKILYRDLVQLKKLEEREKRLADAAESAAKALDKVGGNEGGPRGPKTKHKPTPGAAPTSG